MAKLSRVSIVVSVAGDGVTESQPLAPIINPNAPAGGPLAYSLSSGDNTIDIPPGALGMILLPPSTSTNAKLLKGAVPDTGFGISPNTPSLISFPLGSTSIIVNFAASEAVTIQWL